MLPVRAFWPLPPRPAVLPRPEPWPRPTRFFRCQLALGLLRFEREVISLLLRRAGRPGRLAGLHEPRLPPRRLGRVVLHHLLADEVAHLGDHPPDGRGVLEEPLLAELLQAQAGDGPELGVARPGKALGQLDAQSHGRWRPRRASP